MNIILCYSICYRCCYYYVWAISPEKQLHGGVLAFNVGDFRDLSGSVCGLWQGLTPRESMTAVWFSV